jgi:predicted metal-dependent enzyme (double-stranded beta helix superfamily)
MRDIEGFIEDCRRCLVETDARGAMYELVRETVADPSSVMSVVGEPRRAGVETLYRADDLTILNLVWGPGMDLFPHDHRMWAVIGIYTGQEDNTFYQRGEGTLVRHAVKPLRVGDVASLGVNAIHSVRNPLNALTSALHVYGGDFFGTPRSEWDAVTFEERPYSVEHAMQAFEASNRQLDELAAR